MGIGVDSLPEAMVRRIGAREGWRPAGGGAGAPSTPPRPPHDCFSGNGWALLAFASYFPFAAAGSTLRK